MSEPTSKFSTIRLESGLDDTTDSSSQISTQDREPVYGTYGSLHLSQAPDRYNSGHKMSEHNQPYYFPQQPYMIPQIPTVPVNPYANNTAAPILVQQQDGTFSLQYPQTQMPLSYPRPVPPSAIPIRPIMNPGIPVQPTRRQHTHSYSQVTPARPKMRRVGDKIYQPPNSNVNRQTVAKHHQRHQTNNQHNKIHNQKHKNQHHDHPTRNDKVALVHQRRQREKVKLNKFHNVMEHEAKEQNKPASLRIIHSLVYEKGLWILLTEMVDQRLISNQWVVEKDAKPGYKPPHKDIKKLWNLHKASIRQIVYGQGKWYIIADSIREENSRWVQTFSFSKNFPKENITKAWQAELRVSYLNYCDKWWVMITEQNLDTGNAGQRLVVRNKLPQDDFNEFWKEGRRIQVMAYGQDQWVLIGERLLRDCTQSQSFFWSSELPHQKIKDYYHEQSRRVHSICYAENEKLWAILTENKSKKCQQKIVIDPNWPDKEMQKMKFI
eukprot:TRINITY_DN7839_c0_g1_i1.p1 TRINITY_DN7839_c0_g1~~TRINITY_DN7839_c0_g1_i1.p1  ORF type:complete len:508 (-),score=78.15 TRINITY_DN7839_c0_g1_i1:50-1528(-)